MKIYIATGRDQDSSGWHEESIILVREKIEDFFSIEFPHYDFINIEEFDTDDGLDYTPKTVASSFGNHCWTRDNLSLHKKTLQELFQQQEASDGNKN